MVYSRPRKKTNRSNGLDWGQRRNRNKVIAGSGRAGGGGNQRKVHIGGRTDRTIRGQPQNIQYFNFSDFWKSSLKSDFPQNYSGNL